MKKFTNPVLFAARKTLRHADEEGQAAEDGSGAPKTPVVSAGPSSTNPFAGLKSNPNAKPAPATKPKPAAATKPTPAAATKPTPAVATKPTPAVATKPPPADKPIKATATTGPATDASRTAASERPAAAAEGNIIAGKYAVGLGVSAGNLYSFPPYFCLLSFLVFGPLGSSPRMPLTTFCVEHRRDAPWNQDQPSVQGRNQI